MIKHFGNYEAIPQNALCKLAVKILDWISTSVILIFILPGVFASFAWRIMESSDWGPIESKGREAILIASAMIAWVFALMLSVCLSVWCAIFQ